MTEKDVDQSWPVLAQIVRAIEWHGDPEPDWFCRSFEIERDHDLERLNAAEAEVAALPGARIVEIMHLDPGETVDDAPNTCGFLTAYFN